jgi:hypothetical protein
MNNTTNNAMNAITSANSSPQPKNKFIIVLALIAVTIVGIVAAVTFFYKKAAAPFWSERATTSGLMDSVRSFFGNMYSPSSPSPSHSQISISPVQNQIPIMQAPERVAVKETWCFVGEDLKGRWCVKVPSEHSCDPNRTFPSEEDCSLVKASSMPLGVVQNQGASMMPIGPIPAISSLDI